MNDVGESKEKNLRRIEAAEPEIKKAFPKKRLA
jgi:hypothetical protein